jgi:outer membrane murein-binding lipoprotein Lpp
MTTENKITINETEYNVDDLTQEQKYLVSQLQDLNSKQANLQFQLDQIQAAKTVFGNTLSQLLEPQTEETEQ